MITTLAAGTAYKPHFISTDAAADIQGISSTLAVLVTGVYTIVGTGAVPSATIVGKVAMWLLAPLVALALLVPDPARAASKLPIPLPPLKPIDLSSILPQAGVGKVLTGKPLSDLDNVYKAIQSISLDDLTAAKTDADASKDIIASSCYGALIDLTKAQQAVDTTKLEGQPHLVLTFQRGRDLYNALRPGSAVSIGCAPLAEQVKMDITTLIASVAAGTITMASFGL